MHHNPSAHTPSVTPTMQDLMRMEYFDIFVVTQLRAADAVSLALSCTQGRHLSAVKQRQLRIAISTTDLDNMKWCWVHPPADQCVGTYIGGVGVLARLVRRAENCNVYRTYDSFMGNYTLTIVSGSMRMSPRGIYLIPDSASRIRWIGSGCRCNGGRLFRGLELEQEVIAKLDLIAADSSDDETF